MNLSIILSIIYHCQLLYNIRFSGTPLTQISISNYLQGLVMVLIVGTVITSLVDVLIVKLRIENEFMWLIGSGYKNSLGKYDKDELGSLFLEVIIVDTLKVVSLVILSLVVGKII